MSLVRFAELTKFNLFIYYEQVIVLSTKLLAFCLFFTIFQ